MADEDEQVLVEAELGSFGVRLALPELFQSRVEEDTWLFWDEESGSLRLTPIRIRVRVEDYLAEVLEENDAEWTTLGARRWVTWTQDNEDEDTRSHFYVTGERDLVLLCSWAYGRDLLDDEEYGAMMLEGATEDVMRCLETLRFPD